jgi:hypothetical protein
MSKRLSQLVSTLVLLLIPAFATAQQSNGSLTPTEIDWPTYTQHGFALTIPVTVTNSGDATLSATVTTVELGGPPGWLSVDQTSLSIPAMDQTILNVTYNTGGVINNPGTIASLYGWVLLAVDSPTATDSLGLYVHMIIADTVVLPIWDTLVTSCLALTVGTNGNMGHQAIGGANMNFFADCDQNDTIPGDAPVYLRDASPVVFSNGQAGTWSMYSNGHAFAPVVETNHSAPVPFSGIGYEAAYFGPMVNSDSSLFVETAVYAPTEPDSCNFVIHGMHLWAVDGTAQNNLTVGMLLDWDIPSDSGKQNTFGKDALSDVLWQQGREVNEPLGDALECQQNNARFGGVGLIGYTDGTTPNLNTSAPFALNVAEIEQVTGGSGNFDSTLLYQLLTSTSQPTISGPSDLVSLLTVFDTYDLAAGDTLTIWTVVATVENGSSANIVQAIEDGRAWRAAHPWLPFPLPGSPSTCCVLMGDVNLDGKVNLTDLICILNPIFITFVNNCVQCWTAANVSDDPGCTINLTDIALLVNHLFVTFAPLPDCHYNPNCPD